MKIKILYLYTIFSVRVCARRGPGLHAGHAAGGRHLPPGPQLHAGGGGARQAHDALPRQLRHHRQPGLQVTHYLLNIFKSLYLNIFYQTIIFVSLYLYIFPVQIIPRSDSSREGDQLGQVRGGNQVMTKIMMMMIIMMIMTGASSLSTTSNYLVPPPATREGSVSPGSRNRSPSNIHGTYPAATCHDDTVTCLAAKCHVREHQNKQPAT